MKGYQPAVSAPRNRTAPRDGDPPLPLATRLRRAAQEEVRNFHPRALLAQALARGLPEFSFAITPTALLRAAGVRIGAGTRVMGEVELSGDGRYWELLSIGEDCVITGHLHVDLAASVTVGDRVALGQHVALVTGHHDLGFSGKRCGRLEPRPIHIGDGAWVASRVTVLPGVTIGPGAVVAAGAVVTHDVPADTLVGGVPARPLRELGDRGR